MRGFLLRVVFVFLAVLAGFGVARAASTQATPDCSLGSPQWMGDYDYGVFPDADSYCADVTSFNGYDSYSMSGGGCIIVYRAGNAPFFIVPHDVCSSGSGTSSPPRATAADYEAALALFGVLLGAGALIWAAKRVLRLFDTHADS